MSGSSRHPDLLANLLARVSARAEIVGTLGGAVTVAPGTGVAVDSADALALVRARLLRSGSLDLFVETDVAGAWLAPGFLALYVPVFAGLTLTAWQLIADRLAAEVTIDVWRDTYATFAPGSVAVNLIRTPTSGTATYTASSEFSGAYDAPKAADGNYTDGWATAGSGAAAIWWRCTFSVAQTLTRVVIADRPNGSDWFGSGSGTIRFSDGSTIAFSGLANDGTALTVNFTAKTGITWVQVECSGSAGANPGLAEVEGWNYTGISELLTPTNKPSLVGARKAIGTVTGWTTALYAGDVLRFAVGSIWECSQLTLSLKWARV